MDGQNSNAAGTKYGGMLGSAVAGNPESIRAALHLRRALIHNLNPAKRGKAMKSQTPSLANAARVAWRRSFRFLMALAMVTAARTPAWSADVIYLESNSTAANSIFAFKFDFAAAPTLISITPTGGIGVFDQAFPPFGPFDSDQNLIENPEGTLLFAVNSGSNSIAVFHINSDGSLTAVDGSPFPSAGATL
jgi:hypothetical protein